MVALYILEHKETKLKYFGKTSKYFSNEEIMRYGGSGVYWNRHLKKYGKNISVKIYGIYDFKEVEDIALKFSLENNIIDSKEWANLILENGLDGGCIGYKHTAEAINKIGKSSKGRKHSVENRLLISEAKSGQSYGSMDDNHKAKISKSVKDKMYTKEVQNKLRKSKKPQMKTECPHCGLVGASGNMKRYHFDKCKIYNAAI